MQFIAAGLWENFQSCVYVDYVDYVDYVIDVIYVISCSS